MAADVSVIVPVYNAGKYLKECADSLVRQSLKNIEIIFVDDGSTDDSLSILREYEKRDDRIRIIQQKNMYAGTARNNGMKIAGGKYIIFLDADDFFDLNMLREAYSAAEKYKAQIVLFNYHKYDNERKEVVLKPEYSFPGGVFKAADLGKNLFDVYIPATWNKLFLRSFVDANAISFQTVRKCNDILFTHVAAALADRMIYIPKKLVYYRTNNRSSLQGESDSQRESYINCGIAVKNEMIRRGLYNGPVREACCSYAAKLIRMGAIGFQDMDGARRYYEFVKANLIPNLFESCEDFSEDVTTNIIYGSGSFEECMFLLLQDRMQTVEDLTDEIIAIHNSPEYRRGKTLMKVPRKIKRMLHRDQRPATEPKSKQ